MHSQVNDQEIQTTTRSTMSHPPSQRALCSTTCHQSAHAIPTRSTLPLQPSARSLPPVTSVRSIVTQCGASHVSTARVSSHNVASTALLTASSSSRSVNTIHSITKTCSTQNARRNFPELDYNRIKKELRSGCPSISVLLLQALRWVM